MEYAIIRIRQISASLPTMVTQGPKVQSCRHGGFCGLSPPNEVSTTKLKCETLKITVVFINPYSVLSYNL